jgi:hypothetical protein
MKYFVPTAILLLGTLLSAHSAMPALGQTSPAGERLSWTDDEIAKLIYECGVRTTKMTGRLYDSTFYTTDTDYVIDKQGQIKSEQSKVFEVYPTNIGNRRQWINVQIGANGAAFSAEKIARERDHAVKQTLKLYQQASSASANQITTPYKPRFSSYGIKVEKRGGLSRTIWFINPTDFLVSHDFYDPQRVSFSRPGNIRFALPATTRLHLRQDECALSGRR